MAQWLPVLPTAARAELSAWLASRLIDARGCYALSYHGDEAAGFSEAHVRRITEEPGSISELVTGHLAFPTAATRARLQAISSALASGSPLYDRVKVPAMEDHKGTSYGRSRGR